MFKRIILSICVILYVMSNFTTQALGKNWTKKTDTERHAEERRARQRRDAEYRAMNDHRRKLDEWSKQSDSIFDDDDSDSSNYNNYSYNDYEPQELKADNLTMELLAYLADDNVGYEWDTRYKPNYDTSGSTILSTAGEGLGTNYYKYSSTVLTKADGSLYSLIIDSPDEDGNGRGFNLMLTNLFMALLTDEEIKNFISYWKQSKPVLEGQDFVYKFAMYCSKLSQDIHVTIKNNRQTNRAQLFVVVRPLAPKFNGIE